MAVAVCTVLLAACGTRQPAAAPTSSELAVAASYTWKEFRKEYMDLLLTCDLLNHTDQDVLACWVNHNAMLDSALLTAESLPVSKSRSDLIALMKNYQKSYAEFDAANCNALSFTEVNCIAPVHGLKVFDASIGKVIGDNANAE